MFIVGSSIVIESKGSGFSASHITSPISKPSIPVTAQISPATTLSTFLRSVPSKTNNSFTRCFSCEPSRFPNIICWFSFKSPRCKRPIAIRPTYVEKSKEVINICVFPSSIGRGGK